MTDLEPVAYRGQWPETAQWYYSEYNAYPDAETVEPLVRKSDADAIARERDAMREALTEIRDGFFSEDVCVLIACHALNTGEQS